MEIHIQSRGSFTGRGGHVLFTCAKDSLKDFFLGRPDITEICLIALTVGRADVRQHLVKIKPAMPSLGYTPVGVPVAIHTEGTQGLTCLMSIPGMTDGAVRELVENGPYERSGKHKADKLLLAAPADVPMEPVHDAFEFPTPRFSSYMSVPETAVEGEISPAVVATAPVTVKRMSPLERLHATDTPEDEIERLKVTMASIVYRHVGDGEIPNLLQVSVRDITDAILEHQKLPKNSANNYRGTIANFYSTRFALFALKWDDSVDPEARYDDWLLDVSLVLDFVGGKDKLPALTREREQEVQERLVAERVEEENPPPTAETIEAVATSGFMADAALLDMAMQSLEGKRKAEEALLAAEINAEQLASETTRLEAQLAAARVAHQGSLELVAKAQGELGKYELSPKLMNTIRNAKARLDTLAKSLGL